MENKAKGMYESAKEKAKRTASGLGEKAAKAKENIAQGTVKIVDENGNGKIDLEDFIIKALRVPGVRVNRKEYLEKALKKYCTEELICKAIVDTPAKAGIQKTTVDKAAGESIALQKTLATSTSVGLGYVPGGVAVDISTTVADLAQYYGHQLVIMQKLMYLYGYPEIQLNRGVEGIDDGAMNMLIIGVGVMAGVQEASKYILKMSEMLAKGVAKQMLAQALTKKTAFQVAKKVLKYFGITLTKSLAAKGVANSIKFLGGVLVGGITFVTFNTSCDNLFKTLRQSPLADPNYVPEGSVVDAEFTTVDAVEEEFKRDIPIQDEEE